MPLETNARLRLVVDSLPALVSYVDADHRYRLVNASYERWFGRPRSEVEGRHVRDVLGEAAYQAVLPYIVRVLDGETLSYETVAPYRSGGTRHIHATYVPHRDPDGRVLGYVALVEDVTARKRAEAELATVREETSKILASVADSFCAFDRDFRYTYVNPSAERYLGRAREELLGRVLWEVFPATLGSEGLERLRGAMNRRDAQHFEMLSAITGRWVEVDAYPYERGLAILFRDITERKEAEAALRQSEERLRLACTAADLVVWDMDVVRGTVVCSPEAAAVWGQDRGTIEEFRARIHPEDLPMVTAAAEACLGGVRDFRVEYRVRGPDGVMRWFASRGELRRDPAGAAARMVGVSVDVTERRQIEERLRQSAKMEAIGRLAGGLAHDFNNQLHALSGFADFVARDHGLGPRARHDLLEIQRIADRMSGLTRQLLAFSRQQVLVPETLDLNAAVGESQGLLQRLIGRNIEIVLQPAVAPVWVRVDRAQLLQVLMNLAINGRDAMPDGGTLTIRTGYREVGAGELDEEVGAPVPPGRYASLAVADSGSGIAAEHLPHIFEPFFTTKGVGQGTGLGLATVHGIVSQSQGHIRVRTGRGEGTSFEVLLPEAAQPDEQGSVAGRAPGAPGGPARVLVVDDEEIVRSIVARTLEEAGYRVLQARHGGEALEWLAQLGDQIDVLVSDVVMPVVGGRELARRLAAQGVRVPVVWISGYPREDAPDDGAQLDGPFLQKPVLGDLLVDTVRRVLAGRAAG